MDKEQFHVKTTSIDGIATSYMIEDWGYQFPPPTQQQLLNYKFDDVIFLKDFIAKEKEIYTIRQTPLYKLIYEDIIRELKKTTAAEETSTPMPGDCVNDDVPIPGKN
jgi:hypothetical protein